MYVSGAAANPTDWWDHYRAAWCLNRLGMQDSALVHAQTAFHLAPGEEGALAELLRALADSPERILEYSPMVRGGGVCRYRLARAELELEPFGGASLRWLLDTCGNGDPEEAADAACWLFLLGAGDGLEYIEKAVSLSPQETFYRGILAEALAETGEPERALEELGLMDNTGDWSYWSTAAAVHSAMELPDQALDDLRRAYELRRMPSTGAELGWRLYARSGELIRENMMGEAVLLLIECSQVWHSDCTWAVRADSLRDQLNLFTSTSGGYGEPI